MLLVQHVLQVPDVDVSQNHAVTTIEESCKCIREAKDWTYNEKFRGGHISVKPVMCVVSFVRAYNAILKNYILNSALKRNIQIPLNDGDEYDGGDNKHVIVSYCVGLYSGQVCERTHKEAQTHRHTHKHKTIC